MSIETFAVSIGLLKNAIGLAKDANDLVSDSPKRRAAEIALTQAEQQLRLAESRAAQELGYNLCQCSFPPQIALLQPDGSKRCPKCGRDTDEDTGPVGIHYG
jgi:hypothetical protein